MSKEKKMAKPAKRKATKRERKDWIAAYIFKIGRAHV